MDTPEKLKLGLGYRGTAFAFLYIAEYYSITE